VSKRSILLLYEFVEAILLYLVFRVRSDGVSSKLTWRLGLPMQTVTFGLCSEPDPEEISELTYFFW
jgi:hypothetical protein